MDKKIIIHFLICVNVQNKIHIIFIVYKIGYKQNVKYKKINRYYNIISKKYNVKYAMKNYQIMYIIKIKKYIYLT